MSLTSRVVTILTGHIVARIRFRFPTAGGNVTITPQTFRRVALAINSGSVRVAAPTDLPAGAAAQYNAVARTRANGTVVNANTIEVNSASGRIDEAHVVHESLHCAYDLLRTGIDGSAEEASAYVCSALYCRMTGLPKPLWAGGIFAQAERAAQTLLMQYQRGDVPIPTVGITEWRALLLSVSLHPIYRFQGPGGLSGLLLGRQYTHDG